MPRTDELLSRLFDTTHLCIAYLDSDFNFIRVNKAYADVCARPIGFFPGRNHFQLFPHPENEAIFRSVMASGEPFTIYAKPFVFPDHPERGTTYWDWTLEPVKDPSGKVEGLLFMLVDVTERKRIEAQLLHVQRVEALGQLAGGIAHDFNNLLTAVMGHAELGERLSAQHPEIRHGFQSIVTITGRAAHLTRQLLAFTRRREAMLQVLDLNELVKGTCRMLNHVLGEHVEMVLLLDPAAWRVKADGGQIEQVLMNLVLNARDAMPEGGTLTIRTANLSADLPPSAELPPGDYVRLSVRDTGSGMAPEVAAQAFEPFFTTKQPGQGTGLGLPTSLGIARQHHGAILVDSLPGKGSCFTVLIPRTLESHESPAHRDLHVPGGKETILLVEDQPLVRDVAAKALRSLGYQVLVAVHGAEALALGESHTGPIHLALMDVMLPTWSGETVAQRLRILRPDLKVLFVSGYAENLPEAVLHGEPWAAFLDKPYTPSQLARGLRDLLDVRRPNRSANGSCSARPPAPSSAADPAP